MAMRLFPDVATDGSTARLIEVARASRLCAALPADSGKVLVDLALAVRAFVRAREMAAATSVTVQIDKLVATHEDESFVAMISRHTTAVRKALGSNQEEN